MDDLRNPIHPRVFQFVEAPAFSRYREDYLDDEGFRELQESLVRNPEAGDLVPGAGGIRKLRWKDSRRSEGKRGGRWKQNAPLEKAGTENDQTKGRQAESFR